VRPPRFRFRLVESSLMRGRKIAQFTITKYYHSINMYEPTTEERSLTTSLVGYTTLYCRIQNSPYAQFKATSNENNLFSKPHITLNFLQNFHPSPPAHRNPSPSVSGNGRYFKSVSKLKIHTGRSGKFQWTTFSQIGTYIPSG
jgi:hypothetical protein